MSTRSHDPHAPIEAAALSLAGTRAGRAALQAELARRVASTTDAAPWAFHALTAAVGFTAGSVLVLPAVLFLTGHLGGSTPASKPAIVMTRTVVARAPVTEPPPVQVRAPDAAARPLPRPEAPVAAGLAPGALPSDLVSAPAADAAASPAAPPVLLSAPRPAERPLPQPETQVRQAEITAGERLAEARGLIGEGEILRAREILAGPEVADRPEALFLMGETYDPNVLAALGLTSVRAEVGRARRLYEMAVAGGWTAAKRRLAGLD